MIQYDRNTTTPFHFSQMSVGFQKRKALAIGLRNKPMKTNSTVFLFFFFILQKQRLIMRKFEENNDNIIIL